MRKIVPDDDAGGDGNVHGMLGAELRNLKTAIAGIDYFLMDTLDLVAENNGVFLVGSRREMLEHRGTVSLFDGINLITIGLQ